MNGQPMPEWLTDSVVQRLLKRGTYAVTEIAGVDVAQPASGQGPAYAQEPESGWWVHCGYQVLIAC